MRGRPDPYVGHLADWIARLGDGLVCDYQQAKAFLQALDAEAEVFSFRTFSESHYTRQPGVDPLERAIHGGLDTCWEELTELNRKGAAVSVTINRTHGRGRALGDVLAVRALFLDDDRSAKEISSFGLPPQIRVKTSPGRYHHYWLVKDLPLADFSCLQRELAWRFDGDHRIAALNQSMQLPGFWRRKSLRRPLLPALDRISPLPAYSTEQIRTRLLGGPLRQPYAVGAGEAR
jgi:hypothetical protein